MEILGRVVTYRVNLIGTQLKMCQKALEEKYGKKELSFTVFTRMGVGMELEGHSIPMEISIKVSSRMMNKMELECTHFLGD